MLDLAEQPGRCCVDFYEPNRGLQDQCAEWAESHGYYGVCIEGRGFLELSSYSRDVSFPFIH